MNDDDKALDAAELVIAELSGRKGFDWWWDDVDEDTQDEIREALADRIREVYR